MNGRKFRIVVEDNGNIVVNEVLFARTARRLMEGWAYVRKSRLADTVQVESHEVQAKSAVVESA